MIVNRQDRDLEGFGAFIFVLIDILFKIGFLLAVKFEKILTFSGKGYIIEVVKYRFEYSEIQEVF